MTHGNEQINRTFRHRLGLLLLGPHADVLLRTLRMRVRNHLTERCACEFCASFNALVAGPAPVPAPGTPPAGSPDTKGER